MAVAALLWALLAATAAAVPIRDPQVRALRPGFIAGNALAVPAPNAIACGINSQAKLIDAGGGIGPGEVFGLLVLVGLPHLVGSDVYAKLLSCRDEETARRAALLAAASKVVFGLAVAAIALAARKALPPVEAGQALPAAVLGFLPPAAAALVLVALVATMQTSADVVLLSACAVTVRDLFPRLARGGRGVGAARALAPLYGALGLAVAVALGRNVVETLKLGYSIFAAGIILPVLAAMLPESARPTARGAIAAMIAGGTVAAVGRLVPAAAFGADPVLIGTGVNLAILLLSLPWAPVSRLPSRVSRPT